VPVADLVLLAVRLARVLLAAPLVRLALVPPEPEAAAAE